jgi:hypothetical protein
MKFSKRTTCGLLALLVILNIILRLPLTSHEIGWDSFSIHALANSISTFGEARWWAHPASIGGFYPYSTASAVPFLLSGISQCTGIDMEWTIWLFCVLIGVFSAFTAYLMAGAIWDNDLFKFLVAFGFSISEGVLYFTTWTVSVRGLFVVLLPLFVYLLLKTRSSIVRYSALTIILVIVLTVTHHLVHFVIPIVASYFVVTIYDKLKCYVGFIKVPHSFVSIGLLICFLGLFAMILLNRSFILGTSRYILDDMIMTYTRFIGFLIIFVIGGFIYLVFKTDKSFGEWFLLITLLSLVPVIGNAIYTKWVVISFAFLLVGFGLTNVVKRYNKRKSAVIVIVIVLLLSVCMTGYYQAWHYYVGKDPHTYWSRFPSEATYEGAIWAKGNIDGNMIGHGGMTFGRLFALSGVPTFSGSRACDLAYGFVNITSLNITRIPLSMEWFEEEPYVITSKTHTGTEWYISYIRVVDVNTRWAQNFFSKHRIAYIIENKDVYGGIFIRSIHRDKDCVYDNGKICFWKLGGEEI